MKGGLTYKHLQRQAIAERNVDKALDYLDGRVDSEKLIELQQILRRDLPPKEPR